jgi:protein-L-isoaspartate(D-aspartate) O-methyltransferase
MPSNRAVETPTREPGVARMSLAAVRERYADEIASLARVQTRCIRDAFAAVPRERFLGPPPWTTRAPREGFQTRITSDARELYRDVTVEIDPARNLNNGQPSLHAELIDALVPGEGERVLHVGSGTGYYTAILASCVETSGAVTGIDIDEGLAARARENLRDWPWARIEAGDGTRFDPGAVDAVYVSAGGTHVHDCWLDRLEMGGRIIIPLTCTAALLTAGRTLKITHQAEGFSAWFLSPIGIYPCVGGRDAEIERLLTEAFSRGHHEYVRSLRRDSHPRGETCWLHAENFCLSSRALQSAS